MLIHSGVTIKQMALVDMVTNNDTASFPCALRVQTEAAAIVQGTLPAIIRPKRKSSESCIDIRAQAAAGTTR